MTIEPTLWTTVECSAWMKSLPYDEYLELHHKTQSRGAVLSEEGYVNICKVFADEMHTQWRK